MCESAELDEPICRACLKRLHNGDDLRMILLGDQILCLECRRALQPLSWLKQRRLKRELRSLFEKEAGRRGLKQKTEIFILYEENEAFQSMLERYEKLQDVYMAPIFLLDQKKAVQFLKQYDLWLPAEEYGLFLKNGWSPLALILESAGFSSSMPLSRDEELQPRPTWKPHQSKPGCLVLKNRAAREELDALLQALPVLPKALFLLALL